MTVAQDASNFQKGLRSRAEAAEREVKRLQDKLSATRDELAAAKRAMPLAVLEGLRVATEFCMNSDRFITVTPGREFADAERAAEWVKEQFK